MFKLTKPIPRERNTPSSGRLRSVLTAGLICLTGSLASICGAQTLVLQYSFNDAAIPAVDSMGGVEAEIVEAAAYTADGGGRTGGAGDLGMDIANAGQLRITEMGWLNAAAGGDKVTIAFWQKLHGVKNSSAFWFLSPSSGANQRGMQAHTPWSDNNLYFDTVGCCAGGAQRLSIGNAVDYTVWNHFVFMKDGADKSIWFNGVRIAANSGATPLPTDFASALIGAEPPAGNRLNGILDDFVVFEGALSEAQVAQLAGGTDPDKLTGVSLASEHPHVRGFGPSGPQQALDVPVDFTLVDGNPGTVTGWTLKVDGANAASGNASGTFSHPAPAGGYGLGTTHTAELSFTDSTGLTQVKSRTFTTKYFGPGTLFIEAEDFNYANEDGSGAGQHANFGDPDCSLLGKPAVEGIDYNETNNSNDQNLYRGPTAVEAGKPGVDGLIRGDAEITCSYIVGWNDAGDWYNYTRDFPNDTYKVYARMSSGGAAMHANLGKITSDPTAPDQTVQNLGEFKAPATGNWDVFTTVPLRDVLGNDVVVRLNGPTTLRYSVNPGNLDVNYLAFVPTPVSGGIPPAITQLVPSPSAPSTRDPQIAVTIADRDTQVKGSSIKLFLDSAALTPLVVSENHPPDGSGGATASFNTTTLLAEGSTHTARVTFEDNSVPARSYTVDWSFVVGAFKSSALVIEAEDFNYTDENGTPGLHAEFGDPDGSLFGKAGTLGTDYFEPNNGNDQAVYRAPTGVEAGKLGSDNASRPGAPNTANYIVGWNDAGDWYNYTRTFPAARYNVYARLSSGGAPEAASLSLVTSDASQPDQTTELIGEFRSPATGNWDVFHTVALKNADGTLASVRLSGLQTVRFTTLPGNLDVNYLVFQSADIQNIGPQVVSTTPVVSPSNPYADFGDPTVVSADIKNEDTSVNKASIRLFVDGVNVTASSTVTDTASGVRVEYGLAGSALGSAHTARIEFSDTTGAAGTPVSWSWNTSPYSEDNLFIEIEDWNTDGGRYIPSNPATGEAFNKKSLYNGLAGVHDIDYHNNGNPEADNYRTGDTPNIGLADIASDRNVRGAGDRLGFDVQNDWKVGWNDPGDWFNYTRTFPSGSYNIYARLSSGGADRHAHLDLVSNPTGTGDQGLTRLGGFDAPTTGGWDTFSFIPLRNSAGEVARIDLSGEQTLRLTADPGNFDGNYLMLVPTTAPVRLGFVYNRAAGTITLTWPAGCSLQVSDEAAGPYATVAGATSPLVTTPDRVRRFARLVCP
ncbi:MAG: carbohydrate-binding protein [Verrucomicrobia bacterium]|nr:carbohydrate-binding protein [Verrucomicrobiota bacterium]